MKKPPSKSSSQELLQNAYRQRIWGKIICHFDDDAEKEDIKTRVQVSLITAKMLEADWKFIQKEELDASYKPYFFEFFADVDMSDKTKQDFLRKNNGKILRVYLRKTKPPHSENNIILLGHLLTAASPIQRQGWYLKITEEDDIGKFVSDALKSDNSIPSLRKGMELVLNNHVNPFEELDNKIISFFESPIRGGSIYNVGQGNFVQFYMDSNESFLFDAGMTTEDDFNDDKISAARSEIRRIQPKVIILSHWDIDHIIGVAEINNDKIYEDTIWIAPNPLLLGDKKISFSTARLCLYLLRKNIISLLHQGDSANPLNANEKTESGGKATKYCQNNFEMFQGNVKDDSNERRNNIGLILRIRLCNHPKFFYALFAGDCSFENMPKDLKFGKDTTGPFFDFYAFLLTAHHGSKYALPSGVYSDGNGLAIISYGKNSYGHPDKSHKDILIRNRFFDCWETVHTIRIDFHFEKEYILAIRIETPQDTWWILNHIIRDEIISCAPESKESFYVKKLYKTLLGSSLWILR